MSDPLNTRCAGRKKSFFWSDPAGFTLVETIVAATILFSCIAAAALSYNTAVNLTNKLNAGIACGAALRDIQQEIKTRLFDGENTGGAMLANGMAYAWQAVRKRSSPTILREDDLFPGGLAPGAFQVELAEVALVITWNPDNRPQKFPFEYTELVWQQRTSR